MTDRGSWTRGQQLFYTLVPVSSWGNTPFYNLSDLFLAPDRLYAQGF